MEEYEQFVCEIAKEKLLDAGNLNDNEALKDPESEPYKSKYKAREIWHEVRNLTDKYIEEDHKNSSWQTLVAYIDLKLGINYVETDEYSSGEHHLTKCVDFLEPYRLDDNRCTIYQKALNQYGILWTQRSDFAKALEILSKAEKLYLDFKHEKGGSPLKPEEVICLDQSDGENAYQKRESAFEDDYTHTLYYLAQVYTKLNQDQKGGEYCHVTLCRQLDTLKYDPLDWSLNCATLSQYYINKNNFSMARHCLASASVIIQETSCETSSDEESDIQQEKLSRALADLERCWVKYGLLLLEESIEKSMDPNFQEVENPYINMNWNEKSSLFFNIETTHYEESIADKLCITFDDAKLVFLEIQKHMNTAKKFYSLDSHCSDYVELIQDCSRLYKHLAHFEFSFDRQCKMHKRRVDMLDEVLKELNPQYYMLICRQLLYEISQTYSNMVDLKLAIIEESEGTPSIHMAQKMNQLANNSISYYQQYLATLLTPEKKIPDKYSNDDERPALVAYFCMGRLYSKIIDPSPQKRIFFMEKSLESYKYIVDYCVKNPLSIPKVQAEYDICSEMVQLVPYKIERLRQQIMS